MKLPNIKSPQATLLTFFFLPLAVSAMTVTTSTFVPSPAPVGTVVTFTASVANANAGTLWYRFRAHGYDQDSHTIKDYGPENTQDWTESDHEGPFEIDVDVRNLSTGEVATSAAYFTLVAVVTGSQPVITPTVHPMVYLYSATGCPVGSRMRVRFTSPEGVAQYTPFLKCKRYTSMNFYLAGMRGSATYSVTNFVDNGSSVLQGPVISLTTPASRTDLLANTVGQAATASSPDGILFQAAIQTNPVATDLNGNLLWYYPNSDVTLLTRSAAGGYFFGILEAATGDQSRQVVREVDLTGMTVRATNAARINEQLKALGKRSIGAFHHEARLLPDGKILVLASVEQILTNVQGAGAVDVLGDMILVLDSNMQLVWAWDAFDNLDVTRQATLADKCTAGECPPVFLSSNAPSVNDWTHGNAVQQTPDGNLLYSARAQDFIYKIDYENGAGSGTVLWRLGNGGDFQIQSTAVSPWFSHQHDPQFLANGSTIVLLDNSNVRNLADSTANSRGQVLQLDQQAMTANLVLNADLGAFGVALGAAQHLPNGNYLFESSYRPGAASTYIAEVSPSGATVYSITASAPEFRSFRMPTLYNPPLGTH